jgi:hypothetical protein
MFVNNAYLRSRVIEGEFNRWLVQVLNSSVADVLMEMKFGVKKDIYCEMEVECVG